MEADFKFLFNAITKDDLLSRWPKLNPEILENLVRNGTLSAYFVKHKFRPPIGSDVYVCAPEAFPYPTRTGRLRIGCEWNSIVFSIETIEELEAVEHDYTKGTTGTSVREVSLCSKDIASLRRQLSSLESNNVKLENENARLLDELNTEKAKVKSTLNAHKNSAATQAASVARVGQWKACAAQMVKVALASGEKGPQKRTRTDIKRIARRVLGVPEADKLFGQLADTGKKAPSTVCLDVYWDALPENHKKDTPGAPKRD